MNARRLIAVLASALALSACPYQPVLDEPCEYTAGTGNCFDEERSFVFDDARVDAMDLASLPQSPGACRDPERGRLVTVADGDTFDVLTDDGEMLRVRLLGADTPETYDATGMLHCYGADAKIFSEQLLGRRVALTFDRGCMDRFDRTLAYLWLGPGENDLWQRQLIRRGYASVLVLAPNDFMESTFRGDEGIANAERRGLWEECRSEP